MAQTRFLQPAGFPKLPSHWVIEHEERDRGSDKIRISTLFMHEQNWKESRHGYRALVVLHGLGEHSGRYLHFPHYLGDQIGTFVCPDLRGHGLSTGVRGHVDRFDDFVEDVADQICGLDERLKSQFGRSEIYLYGHSMGGHIAMRTLLLHPELPIRSAIVSAPFLGIKANVPVAKRLVAKALGVLLPKLLLDTGLNANDLSHDAAVVENYKNDPLNHSKMTPGLYRELRLVFADTLSRNEGIKPPVLFIVPLEDHLVDADATQRFFAAHRHENKKMKTYPGFFHEPHNEIGKDQVFAEMKAWLSGVYS